MEKFLKTASEYLISSKILINNTNNFGVGIFLCQMAVECALKSLFIKKYNRRPPKIHNLSGVFDDTDEEIKIILNYAKIFENLKTDAKYPSLNKSVCEKFDEKDAELYYSSASYIIEKICKIIL